MAEIMTSVAAIFLTRPTSEWEDLLGEADIPHARMHTLDSLVDDPHLAAVGFFPVSQHATEGAVRALRVPSQWSVSQPRPERAAPQLGEHSSEVLAEAGYSQAEIQRLLAADVVTCPGVGG